MTIKELTDELNSLLTCMPEIENYELNMTGYDIDGERVYDIKVNDLTINSTNQHFTFWDR